MARAYDAKTGTLRRVFKGHEQGIACLLVVGGKLYTGCNDGTLGVWDLSKIEYVFNYIFSILCNFKNLYFIL